MIRKILLAIPELPGPLEEVLHFLLYAGVRFDHPTLWAAKGKMAEEEDDELPVL